MKWLLLGLVHIYRFCLSPFVGNCCRFYPSCSEYSLIALKRHGAIKGSYLTVRRLLRCNPWNAGGVDEVPLNPKRPDSRNLGSKSLDSKES
ncbi:membrane protein insertion efficiency factor YidD [Candidatus Aerophobetes bacterium]|uniref:Putative membrane protein insertion efficiency factor n=1 Tax=Aerophobetes bacterium TaxID=2030807 RepID=A0A2A4YDE7_UNCAE|nr:MAG: membrane protein insertion efficiency factor YidD [Candidatus Aerophobetes bacterium]